MDTTPNNDQQLTGADQPTQPVQTSQPAQSPAQSSQPTQPISQSAQPTQTEGIPFMNETPSVHQTWQARETQQVPQAQQPQPQPNYAQYQQPQSQQPQQAPAQPTQPRTAQTAPWMRQQQYITGPGMSSKSKIVAGLFGIFFGGLGVHNFYLGKSGRAVIQLLLTCLGWVIFGLGPIASIIWGLVEGIEILGSHPGSPWHTDGNNLQLQD